MTSRDRDIAIKIQSYCAKINKFAYGHDYQSFVSDDKTTFSCSFALGQIGELANKLSDEFKKNYIQLPWKKMTALRHRIVHGYDSVEMDLLWDIVKDDVPKLHEYIQHILLGGHHESH